MSIFSRRKSDPRKVWDDNNPQADDNLSIPPCEMASETPSEILGDIAAHENSRQAGIEKAKFEKLNNTLNKDIDENFQNAATPQCWAFMGAVGGVGTTSLAVQLAYELAKLQKSPIRASRIAPEPQVCLIDLDFESGRTTHHLDIKPNLSIEDLNNDTLQIDVDYTKSLMSHHKSGMSVLAAPNLINGNAKVETQTVLALLDAACDLYPYVILDLPKHWQAWSMAAIGGSDFTGLVTDMTIPSLHVTQSKYMQLHEMFKTEKSFQIILNKYEKRSFKRTLTLSDVQMALSQNIFETLCNDSDVIREALNSGEPIGAIKPDSRYAKDSRKLLNKILAMKQIAKRHSTVVNEAAA